MNSTGLFRNSALLINGTQTGSRQFKLMEINANIQPLVDMYGTGETEWHNGMLIVQNGGVSISGGGETIFSGGLVAGTDILDGIALSINVSLTSGYVGK